MKSKTIKSIFVAGILAFVTGAAAQIWTNAYTNATVNVPPANTSSNFILTSLSQTNLLSTTNYYYLSITNYITGTTTAQVTYISATQMISYVSGTVSVTSTNGTNSVVGAPNVAALASFTNLASVMNTAGTRPVRFDFTLVNTNPFQSFNIFNQPATGIGTDAFVSGGITNIVIDPNNYVGTVLPYHTWIAPPNYDQYPWAPPQVYYVLGTAGNAAGFTIVNYSESAPGDLTNNFFGQPPFNYQFPFDNGWY